MNTLLSRSLLLFALALVLVGCVGPGGQSPVVGYASVRGNGDARIDMGGHGIAIGDLHGETGLFMQGSGFPLTFPLDVNEGGWLALEKGQEMRRGEIGVDLMPWWVASLFRPGELDALAFRLGITPGVVLVEAPPTADLPAPDLPTP